VCYIKQRLAAANVNGKLNPLNAVLNPICHLLALLGAHHILHVSKTRVNKKIRVFYSHTRATDAEIFGSLNQYSSRYILSNRNAGNIFLKLIRSLSADVNSIHIFNHNFFIFFRVKMLPNFRLDVLGHLKYGMM
jgi:hypothetical protein